VDRKTAGASRREPFHLIYMQVWGITADCTLW